MSYKHRKRQEETEREREMQREIERTKKEEAKKMTKYTPSPNVLFTGVFV